MNQKIRRELHSLEIHALVKEQEYLKNSKISKVFQNNNLLTFHLHVPGEGKKFFNIYLPGIFFVSDHKFDYPQNPPGFCMFLRKKIMQGIIRDIKQRSFDRILEIDIYAKGENYKLIIELFFKGNVTLTDEVYNILGTINRNVKERTFNNNEIYEFPEEKLNPLIKEDLLKAKEIINKDESNFSKFFASKYSLGGFYSKILVDKFNLNSIKEMNEENLIKFNEYLLEINNHMKSSLLLKNKIPINFSIFEENFSELLKEKDYSLESFESFDSLLLKTIPSNLFVLEKNLDKKLDKITNVIKHQEIQIDKLKDAEEKSKKRAELIYNNYIDIQNLTLEFNKLIKEKSGNEVIKILKEKYKILEAINFEKKEFVLDLE